MKKLLAPYSKVFRNTGILLSGNVVSKLINLFTLFLTARYLGTGNFGTLVFVQTFVLIVITFVSFQPWQAIINYGTKLSQEKDGKNLKLLVSYGFFLDLLSAILGFILSLIFIHYFSHYFNFSEDVILYSSIYSVVILFYINGTPTALLRIYDKFKLFAFQEIITAIVKVILISITCLLQGDLIHFVLVWVLTDIIADCLLLYFGLKEYLRRGNKFSLYFSFKEVNEKFKGIWQFVWMTNLQRTIKIVPNYLDIIMIQFLLGANTVGVYKIAKSIAATVNGLADPLYQAIYPQLAKYWSGDDKNNFFGLVKVIGLIMGAIGIVAWLGIVIAGNEVIVLTMGLEYSGAYEVLVWYFLGVIVSMVGLPIAPAMLSMGLVKQHLYIVTISSVLYLIILYFSLLNFQLAGAGIAYFMFYAIWLILYVIYFRSERKNLNEINQPN
ncbi:oligosaccharide flippase family protein [Planomicrobium sp. CPCC 101079]|uniref:oligosaccharide flippase family protein n=1 Tax=Planomicrobium sp. CPCC 101079 TaxID=2599618 RepID=UPI0011B4357F|nr:oligosaccharide flippase family protein [Planomicrobium sp. CPCC 101079]TWT03627.1 oligosaccharide flippase family protein [Planomicrobium sp. CPCC 101079]